MGNVLDNQLPLKTNFLQGAFMGKTKKTLKYTGEEKKEKRIRVAKIL